MKSSFVEIIKEQEVKVKSISNPLKKLVNIVSTLCQKLEQYSTYCKAN